MEANNELRLPWHKPEIARISVNMDTNSSTGSGTDLNNEDTLV